LNPRSALLGAVVLVVTSLASAVFFIALDDWFGVEDVSAFIFWSLPLAGLVYLSFRKLPARLTSAAPLLRYPALAIIGGIAGIGWTIVVALLLGGWIGAFSIPVFICWVAGGLVAGIAAVWHSDRRSWHAAVVSLILIVAALLPAGEYILEPEPHVRVVLGPQTTHADEETFWREVVGTPGRTPTEHGLIEGISGVGIVDYERGRPVFEVRLRKGISRQRHDSILSRIHHASIVARIDTLP
jgi:hypothetical protein